MPARPKLADIIRRLLAVGKMTGQEIAVATGASESYVSDVRRQMAGAAKSDRNEYSVTFEDNARRAQVRDANRRHLEALQASGQRF